MKTYVLDNSALIPLFFEEQGTEFIQNLLQEKEAEFIAPEFLAIELSNVFATGIRRQKITKSEATQYLNMFQQLSLDLKKYPLQKNLQHVLDLATQTGLSFYDAVYLGLAEQQGAILVTHDKRLLNEAEKQGVSIIPNEV
jgi:predicted nucleic acid-binding protein